MAIGAGPAAAQTAAPAPAATVVTTAMLAQICGQDPANQDSPHTAFCRGVLVGVGQYHRSVSSLPGQRPLFCLPEPSPTIETVQRGFVAWAAANGQFGNERAVDGLMRFAAATYPCPPAPPARRR
jgi:hypothetical protein